MIKPTICNSGAKTPVIPEFCDDGLWEVPVNSLSDIKKADRDHAYILPDDSVWVLSHDGKKFIQLNLASSGEGQPTQVKNNDGLITVDGSGTHDVSVDIDKTELAKLMQVKKITNDNGNVLLDVKDDETMLQRIIANGAGLATGSAGKLVADSPSGISLTCFLSNMIGKTCGSVVAIDAENNLYTRVISSSQWHGEWSNNADVPLYTSLGENEDGSMTQKAVREVLFADVETEDIQIGSGAKAHNTCVSIGHNAISQSPNSVAIGSESSASASTAVALGRSAKGKGVSLGSFTETEMSAVAIGSSAKATALNAIALGIVSEASGMYSIAQGMKSKATATNAIAIGTEAESTIGSGVSIGNRAKVTTTRSVALGSFSRTTRRDTVSIGDQADDAPNFITRIIENVKDPELDQDAATKKYVDSRSGYRLLTDLSSLIIDSSFTALTGTLTRTGNSVHFAIEFTAAVYTGTAKELMKIPLGYQREPRNPTNLPLNMMISNPATKENVEAYITTGNIIKIKSIEKAGVYVLSGSWTTINRFPT